jgi:hypothetical protein
MGFLWTITNSGHISFNSEITKAVNSRPLSLCYIILSYTRFYSWWLNSALNKGIGRSPYEALFGKYAIVGLTSETKIPKEILATLEKEEDFKMTPYIPTNLRDTNRQT